MSATGTQLRFVTAGVLSRDRPGELIVVFGFVVVVCLFVCLLCFWFMFSQKMKVGVNRRLALDRTVSRALS